MQTLISFTAGIEMCNISHSVNPVMYVYHSMSLNDIVSHTHSITVNSTMKISIIIFIVYLIFLAAYPICVYRQRAQCVQWMEIYQLIST